MVVAWWPNHETDPHPQAVADAVWDLQQACGVELGPQHLFAKDLVSLDPAGTTRMIGFVHVGGLGEALPYNPDRFTMCSLPAFEVPRHDARGRLAREPRGRG